MRHKYQFATKNIDYPVQQICIMKPVGSSISKETVQKRNTAPPIHALGSVITTQQQQQITVNN